METRKELEEKLEELRKQREAAEKVAREFCQAHISKLEQKVFDITSFLDDLGKFDERTFEFTIGSLITAKKSFWENLSKDELKTFLEYVITIRWFKQDKNFAENWKRDVFENASKNTNGVNVLSNIYINNAKTNPDARRYIARGLANSEKGLTELVNILKIDDANIQGMALYVLAEHCIPSGFYPPYVTDNNLLYLDTIRGFAFHANDQLSAIAVKALHRGKLLKPDEVIRLMEIGGSERTVIGIESLWYIEVEPNKTETLISLIVKALEHNKIDVSNEAQKGIAHLAEKFSDMISDEILDALIIRKSNYPKEFFNTNIATSALRETFKWNPRLPGKVLHKLCEIAYASNSDVRNRALFVAMALNKKEFLALVNEQRESNPSAARAILNTVTGTLDTDQIANQISQTDPKDVQQNAANQITVLAKYYENGLLQAKTSFNWAIAITIFSILSFIVAVLLFVNNTDKTGTVIAAVGGALTQLVAGTLLLIYRQTLLQLDNYTQQMSKVQNYLLANSFAESLEGNAKEQARIELINTVANSANLK